MRYIIKRIKRIGRKPRAIKKLMKRNRIYRKVEKSVARRRAKELRLKLYGIISISISFLFLFSLLFKIIGSGYTGFLQTQIKLSVEFSQELVEDGSYRKILKNSLINVFPEVVNGGNKRDLNIFISKGSIRELRDVVKNAPENIGQVKDMWLPVSSDVDMFVKGRISEKTPEEMRIINNRQISWIRKLQEKDLIKKSFNVIFFTSGDSREAEMAGILGSLTGSIFIIISCMSLAFPLGVMTAIYLEEFAPKNKITAFIEVNIGNLAAVPSIVFGLLGLKIYLHFFDIPRSAPLAGGLTLALMTLPIIVIATRTSIRAIPQSIKDGAIAIGASRVQTTFHHVLPLAMPGIMTGTILSIARVLGETAPLIMIGMVAFVVDIPQGFTDAATALPAQIYLWSDSPEIGFVEKTSAAIMVLLVLLAAANTLAAFLRKKFEIRW